MVSEAGLLQGGPLWEQLVMDQAGGMSDEEGTGYAKVLS